ncbi:MAG: pentapeptide repeat-containing protein [Deltaproteobacteria bacterium]|nr:pentapeptide repeat-containing protein [Deltaproteobacteria bacterium]
MGRRISKTRLGGFQARGVDAGAAFDATVGATVSNVRLTEPIESGKKLASWRGVREGGASVTVFLMLPGTSKRERDTFAKASERIRGLRATELLPGVAPITEVVAASGVAIADLHAAGTLADLPVLDWDFQRRLALVRRLGLILSVLHKRAVFHGCIRPQNILLDEQFEPMLSEIGALVLEDSFPGTADTRHEYWMYAAREVRQGQSPNASSDVFSLGRLLHYVLVGDEPDEPDEPLPRLDSLATHADTPPGLVRIVRRATSREPAQRHDSIEQFLDELARYSDAAGVGVAHPEGLEGRESKLPRRDSVTAPALDPRASMRGELPRAEAKGASSSKDDVKKPEGAKKPDGQEAAKKPEGEKVRVVPMQVIRSTASSESIDPISGTIAVVLGALGLIGLLAAAGLAYRAGDVAGVVQVVGVVGAALVTAWLPGLSRWYLLRPVWAAACVALVILGDPWELAAVAGRQAKFSKGTPAQRAAAVEAMAMRGRKQFRDLDLTNLDLSRRTLADVDFTGTKLAGALFEGADLSRVNFSDADIGHADFRGARLTDAQVSSSVGWREAVCNERTVMPQGWSCPESNPRSDHDVAGIRR